MKLNTGYKRYKITQLSSPEARKLASQEAKSQKMTKLFSFAKSYSLASPEARKLASQEAGPQKMTKASIASLEGKFRVARL